MKIRKLRASFGKLQNDTLTLHDGLNVVYAPNESGKSTWCAFIQAMLYGIDTSERARNNYLPDKQRYAPWSGAPMEGSMELESDGAEITLQRRTTSRSSPMRDFTAVYTGTNTPVEGMTAQNCGELLTGVNRDVFSRSAFIAQGAVAISGSPELEKRIQSIVASGEEETSYTEAAEQLSAWQRKRRYHRRGLLPELEGEMDENQRLLDDMQNSVDTIQKLETQLEETRAHCTELETQVTRARQRQRTDALNRLRNGRVLVQQRSDSHDDALAELSRCQDALRQSDFGDRSYAELQKQLMEDRGKLEALEEDCREVPSFLPALVFSILAIVAAALYGFFEKLPLIILAGILCIVAVIFFLRYSRAKQDVNNAQLQMERILRRYRISVPEELEEILRRHSELQEAVRHASQEELRTRESLSRASQELRDLEESAISDLDIAGGDSEAAQLSRALVAARNEAAQLATKISGLNGRLSAMGDPMVLASSLAQMREEYETIQDEYDAITLAQELLRQANQEIQNRFSPKLSRLAAKYMAEMTGGRYEDLMIGQNFSARARLTGDSVAHDSEYLSAGTMDLMYLAVRLAVCELALPEGEPCPLIIDDALVNLDETRFNQAMVLLKKIALERQVVLFTCRK